MNYRREIDGLRALAVLPVIAFHGGFTLFSGGFVGVDVFFVISGYLITSIILHERRQDRFSLADFYERRARRILPALFVMMFACLPAAWFWLLPKDLAFFSQGLVAVPLFASNFLFYATSGYFETAAELNPLLHTWSLAVEEQYYLLYPLFLLLAWRLGTRAIVALLAVAAAASFLVADWGATRHPAFAFFLLPTRGWELLAGAFAAFYLAGKVPRDSAPATLPRVMAGEAFSALGVVLIAIAVFAFDKRTPFPGLYALLPVVGTLLIILFASPATRVGQWLGKPLLVGIGLISYSAYLWHQPLFAFARYRSADEPGTAMMLLLAAAALLLGWLSWKFVEMPFRNRHRFSRRQVVQLAVLCAGLLITAGLVIHANHGFDNRLDSTQKKIAAFSHYDYAAAYQRGQCFLEKPGVTVFSATCANSLPQRPTILVWGDSYAAALSSGLRRASAQATESPGDTPAFNVVQYSASGCPPILDTVIRRRPECLALNRFVLAEIRRLQPSQIWLHGNWHTYEKDAALPALAATLAQLQVIAPAARVKVIGSAPQWSPGLPAVLVRRHVTLDREQSLPMPALADLQRIDALLAPVATANGAEFASLLAILCTGNRCQVVVGPAPDFVPAAWDNGHLTVEAATLLARKLL